MNLADYNSTKPTHNRPNMTFRSNTWLVNTWPSRKETKGVAWATLRLTDTAGDKRSNDAIKIGISIICAPQHSIMVSVKPTHVCCHATMQECSITWECLESYQVHLRSLRNRWFNMAVSPQKASNFFGSLTTPRSKLGWCRIFSHFPLCFTPHLVFFLHLDTPIPLRDINSVLLWHRRTGCNWPAA